MRIVSDAVPPTSRYAARSTITLRFRGLLRASFRSCAYRPNIVRTLPRDLGKVRVVDARSAKVVT
jgi:hypothetical protein